MLYNKELKKKLFLPGTFAFCDCLFPRDFLVTEKKKQIKHFISALIKLLRKSFKYEIRCIVLTIHINNWQKERDQSFKFNQTKENISPNK